MEMSTIDEETIQDIAEVGLRSRYPREINCTMLFLKLRECSVTKNPYEPSHEKMILFT